MRGRPRERTYGKFTVEPLERGYGITLGNALRRIMLSSLPGTAATSIKIAGVQHEFSTIPGVKEDVTEIVLNVKSLITRLHNTDGIKTVYIEAVGPCEVKAGDIKGTARSRSSTPTCTSQRWTPCDAQHGADAFSRPRLCVRRPQQDSADGYRRYSR